MTTTIQITDEQIDALRIAAGQAGDMMQVAICNRALGYKLLQDDDTLTREEMARMAGMSITDAVAECARVIAANCGADGDA